MQKTEYAIVGWGLSGAVLAWELYFRNKSVVIFDSGVNHSTRTAAGIVNPIVFKRLTKSWKADTLMPKAESFYLKIEAKLGQKIIESKHIYKVFTSFEDENNWMVKQSDDRFSKYLFPIDSSIHINQVQADYGYGVVNTFGNLNTQLFLDASKAFFISNGYQFVDEPFEYQELITEGLIYKNDSFNRLLFCEGVGIQHNPFFSYLPLKPTHGDTLIVESDEFDFDHILNKNMFIMRLKGNQFKVGATYNWELTDPITTEAGKNELIEKLKQFTQFPFKVISQQAGIRPTVKDRRPLIGSHPKHENIYVFNGMGTKGVMIAPFFANELIDFIENGIELDKEVDIKRYEKYLN